MPGAVDVSRSSRAHCPYAFGLRASRACYPRFGLDWHAPGSGRCVSKCPAPWTCAAAAGPTVLAPSVCVLRVRVTLVSVRTSTHLIKGAVLQGAGHVPQPPSTLVRTDTMHGVYQAGASAAGDSHTPAASTGIHRHPQAHIIIFFPQTQIPVSGVLQCWILALHVSVPVFRVQDRAVQSRASKTQVAHSNFCFAG